VTNTVATDKKPTRLKCLKLGEQLFASDLDEWNVTVEQATSAGARSDRVVGEERFSTSTGGASPASQQPSHPRKPGQRTLRFRLACLVMACVLPVCAIAGFVVHYDYQQKQILTEQRVLETARALSMVVDQQLATMQASTMALATSHFLVSGDLAAFHRQARAVLHEYPGATFTLADAVGQQLVNTSVPFGTPLPKRTKLDLVERVFGTGKPLIVNLFKGNLLAISIVGVEVPVIHHGRVVYDLALVAPASNFEAVFSRAGVPPDWTVSVVDTNGVIVARSRFPEKFVGRVANPDLVREMAGAAEGVLEYPNQEGTDVLVVFSRSTASGWAAVFGIPKALMLADLQRWLWWTIAGALLLSMMGIALALYRAERIGGSIRALIAPALALGGGEAVNVKSSDLIEADEVGQSLARASQLLQQRTAERDQVEDSLQTSLQRLYIILSSLYSGILLVTAEGRVEFANRSFCDHFLLEDAPGDLVGLAGPEMIAKIKDQYRHPDEALARIQEIVDLGEPVVSEEVAMRDGGTCLRDFVPLNVDGKLYGRLWIHVDITRRKRAEEQLQLAKQYAEDVAVQLRSVVENMAERLYVCDSNGHPVLLNGAFRRTYFGTDAPEFPQTFAEQWEAFDMAGNPVPVADWPIGLALRGQKVRGAEFRTRSKLTGKEMISSYNASPVLNSQGKVVMALFTTLDITERKRAEEALRLSEEKLAKAFAINPAAIVITRMADGMILDVNEAFVKMFGHRRSEVIGKSALQYWPNAEDRVKPVRELQEKGFFSGWEQTMLRRSGEPFVSLMSAVVLNVGDEQLILSTWLDITERKRAQEALLRSEKLASVGHMAAVIAHEINNPLEAVTNALFLASTIKETPESARHFLEIADAELKRIAHITRQSLGFYRESNAPTLMSVNQVLDSTIDLLKSRVKAKNAVIEKQWIADVEITAVAGELRQVFSNLLANSLDAITERGTIKLRVSTYTLGKNDRSCVRITVADNGKGISRDARPHLFEPFFTTKGAVGTGLGLWVSKQIVDKHGGTICMRSTSDGARSGAVFSVVLPVEPAAATRSQSAGQ
jgi:PAS domain S-box-containing protein